ncbi:MAG: TAXI family TRAP transporter solute-binding subunit [Rhodocyclaceae bacterium]
MSSTLTTFCRNVFARGRIGLAVLALGMLAPQAARSVEFRPDGIPAQQVSRDPADPNAPSQYFMGIYSGSTHGVYYYAASAICEAMRARYDEHRIRCAPFRSRGVSSNRSLMNQGRAQFAIVQSDTNYYAATGEAPILGARSVLSLHDETGLLITGPSTPFSGPDDLGQRPLRLNLAPDGSAANTLWIHYLESLDLTPAALGTVYGFAQDLNYEGLCTNFIDVFAIWSGHPVPALERAVERCGARLFGLWHTRLDSLLANRPYYYDSELPAGTYPGQATPLRSYGVKASLIAHEQTDPYIVYWVTRVLIENVDFLRSRHPSLATLDPLKMFEHGNFLPFHEGALYYWNQLGWEPPTPPPAVREALEREAQGQEAIEHGATLLPPPAR